MLVFKFGGASVKNAEAIKNVSKILSLYASEQRLVVISAMGKTTNALEEIAESLWKKNVSSFRYLVEETYNFHINILNQLFKEKHYAVHQEVEKVFDFLRNKIDLPLSDNFDFEYDQIVSQGEILSTLIVECYLREEGHPSVWADARKLIRTDRQYRDSNVDWEKTQELVHDRLLPLYKSATCVITQGFIGHTSEGFTTTLGREGSDYSAGIFAFCIDAKSVTIWKDVPGMLNADPKWFSDTVKLDQISFKEAIELAYYGASVIHPKTIKPLQNKQIPLFVKSFIDPNAAGTIIQTSMDYDHLVPSFIFKLNQVLFSITPKDFSFIVEENLSSIFETLSSAGIKINLMQNSALSFSFAVDQDKINIDAVLSLFRDKYEIKFNDCLELITIRHYDAQTIEKMTHNKTILIEQKTRQTVRFLAKNKD